MNDSINIKIGAEDTGFESALKTVQAELSRLEGKVQAGDLTFKELDKTMKEIGKVQALEARLKAIGDASAESSPKIQNLGNDIDRAGDKAKSAGGIFDAEFQKIAGAFTVGNLATQGFQKVIDLAFDAARAVVQGFSDALDLGGRLNELSSRTGETAGKLLVLETAFKNSGLEASTVGTAINKLQNFMQDAANGGDKQRAAMQSLGVSMSELAGKTPTEQMKIFADRIAGIEDPTARAAAASEVFGDKLGGKLLPLFSDFSTNLEDARAKVGSLEEVMDANAATFDAAAETIEAVKGKMAAFAAGVLGETIPAVRELGSEMEKVDAAGLGETVGKILSPALRDFTRDIQVLLTIFGELKNQFTDFSSALVGGADNFKKISEEANKYLQVLAALLPGGLNPVNLAIKGLAETTKDLSTQTDTATGKVDALGTSAQATGQNIASAFSLTSDFAPKLEEISGSWGGVNEQILGGKNLLSESYSLADSMTGKIEEQTAGFGGVNEQLTTSKDLSKIIEDTYGKHAEKLAEIQAKQDAIAAKEAEKNALQQESLNMELAIAEAKAAGDEDLVKTLENQKLFNAELKKATDAGMGEPQARAFAQQMVNAKNAAAAIGDKAVTISVTTKVDDTRWKSLLAELNNTPDQKTIDIALQVTGAKDLSGARQTLVDMDSINKNYQAAFSATGASSIEEVRNNLLGIPTQSQKELAMKITGEKDLARAIQKLDSVYPSKEVKLELKEQGFTNIDQLQNQLKGIPDQKRSKLILETLGMTDVKSAENALNAILANSGKKVSVQATADTTQAQKQIAALGGTSQVLNLDASKSIDAIKTKLKDNIDLAVTAGTGTKILQDVKTLLGNINTTMTTLSNKLPVPALV